MGSEPRPGPSVRPHEVSPALPSALSVQKRLGIPPGFFCAVDSLDHFQLHTQFFVMTDLDSLHHIEEGVVSAVIITEACLCSSLHLEDIVEHVDPGS